MSANVQILMTHSVKMFVIKQFLGILLLTRSVKMFVIKQSLGILLLTRSVKMFIKYLSEPAIRLISNI